METQRLFERHDPISGDALFVGLDGDRLLVRLRVEARTTSLILTDSADTRRLADALRAALRDPTRVPRQEVLCPNT